MSIKVLLIKVERIEEINQTTNKKMFSTKREEEEEEGDERREAL